MHGAALIAALRRRLPSRAAPARSLGLPPPASKDELPAANGLPTSPLRDGFPAAGGPQAPPWLPAPFPLDGLPPPDRVTAHPAPVADHGFNAATQHRRRLMLTAAATVAALIAGTITMAIVSPDHGHGTAPPASPGDQAGQGPAHPGSGPARPQGSASRGTG
jgi:hypothetical protein